MAPWKSNHRSWTPYLVNGEREGKADIRFVSFPEPSARANIYQGQFLLSVE